MVKISLPNPNDFMEQKSGGMKSFLRQLELCVHHAQKAYDQLVADGLISDTIDSDSFVIYRHPMIKMDDREQDEEGYVKVHVDEVGDEMNFIEIELS